MKEQKPLSQEEYLRQVECDMPGGKRPPRILSVLALGLAAALLIGAVLFCRSQGWI